MGQKVNPHGLRVGVIKDWDSRWFAKENQFRRYPGGRLQTAQIPEEDPVRRRRPQDRDRTRRLQRAHPHPLRQARHGHRQGRRGDRKAPPDTARRCIGKPVLINIVEVKQPRSERAAGGREHCRPAGEAHLLPPRHEAGHRPRHAAGRQGHQDPGLRPSGRRGNRPYRAVSRRAPSRCRPCAPTSTTALPRRNTTYGRIGVKVWIYSGEVLADAVKAQNQSRREGGRK